MRRSWRRASALLWMVLTGCAGAETNTPASAPPDPRPVIEPMATGVDTALLARAVETRMAGTGIGPIVVDRVWRWHPVRADEVLVWTACRGAGAVRACAVASARNEPGQLRMFLVEAVGWGVPQLGVTADRQELIVSGDDGHGTWRQLMRFDPGNNGSVAVNRRMYEEGW